MQLPKYDPHSQVKATSSDINDIRLELEQKPVVIDGRPYDCKPSDLQRMEAVGLANADKDIEWTLADNTTYVVKGALLLNIHDDIKDELGKRILKLHEIAQTLKKKDLTLRDIQPDQWIAQYKTA